jgi:predicted secreted protein
MRLSSIIAIYSLFWALSFFFVLPFRLQRKGAPPAAAVRGEMRGAPPSFSFGRTSLWTTIVALVLFGLYYANYVTGWLPVEALDFVPRSVLQGH